jgi:NAD(P)-dependent dehydrogenase (short-subunit alcohol dehydrogenase family)
MSSGISPSDVANEEHCQQSRTWFSNPSNAWTFSSTTAGIGHVGFDDANRRRGPGPTCMLSVLRGVFNMAKVFLPGMLAQSRQHHQSASIGGVVAVRIVWLCAPPSSPSSLTKSRLDHAKEGIRCCICPGRVETPFVSARLKEYPIPRSRRNGRHAGARTNGAARRNRGAALYLASDESAFVTGTAFLIDGGWSAGK